MRILYFAWLKQRTGVSEERIDPPDDVRTVEDLVRLLAARHPRFGEAAATPGVVHCAVNHEHVGRDAPIRAGDEIAFFPPVTGG